TEPNGLTRSMASFWKTERSSIEGVVNMPGKRTAAKSEQTTGEEISVSRRSLLVGSVGATVGGLLTAEAMAQSGAHTGHTSGAEVAQSSGVQTAERHRTYPGSLSNRIYSVNPIHPAMADIAENPTNIPPPI